MRLGVSISAVASMAFAASALAQGAREDLIAKHSVANEVPEALVRRVIKIESSGNPGLVSRGNYGLMQIRLRTAREMGYDGGPQGLLDADTNMKYAVKYLAGAYRAAGCNPDRAVALYQHGYVGRSNTRCESQAQYLVAQAESKPVKMPARSANPGPQESSPDVLKPKVVHTVPVSKQENAQAKAMRPMLPAPALTDPVTSDPVTANHALADRMIVPPAAVPGPGLPARAEPAVKADTFEDRISVVPTPPVAKRGDAETDGGLPPQQAKQPAPPAETKSADQVEVKGSEASMAAKTPGPPIEAKKSAPVVEARTSDPSAQARKFDPSTAEIGEAKPAHMQARKKSWPRRYHADKPEPVPGLVSLIKKLFTPEKQKYRRVRSVDALQAVR